MHESGIVHRDLKLENVLLDKDSHCKVCDFGLAHVYPIVNGRLEVGKLREVCGSKSYCAPEVLAGHGYIGFPTDVWSCGIVRAAPPKPMRAHARERRSRRVCHPSHLSSLVRPRRAHDHAPHTPTGPWHGACADALPLSLLRPPRSTRRGAARSMCAYLLYWPPALIVVSASRPPRRQSGTLSVPHSASVAPPCRHRFTP